MKTRAAGGLTLGGVLLLGAVLASAWLGGPDLTGLLSGEPSRSESNEAVLSTASEPGEPPASRMADRHGRDEASADPAAVGDAPAPLVGSDEAAIRRLIDDQISGEMVEVRAQCVKLLPDDTYGSRHQRLLLALESGGTVLISHNIDLAERVPVAEGEWLTVYGQYEWNDRGGVLHWTHHDPKGWREGGWIEHAGVRYE